jgi:hypothetical protein
MAHFFKGRSLLIGLLLALCYPLTIFIKSYIAQSMCDPEWSTNILFDSGPASHSTDVNKIEVIYSNKNNGEEQSYNELLKVKPVITLDNMVSITEFLNHAHTFLSAFKVPALNDIDLNKPVDTFHIIVWRRGGASFGYGRLLVFRKDGRKYGVLKAADGTGDYRYNSELLPYIEQLRGNTQGRITP